jgi:predicted dehydrogenase
MLPALASVAEVEVAAIASRDPGRAEQMSREVGARAVCGYAELLELDDVDAVYVPLPAAMHADWVEAALLAGKHVLAEKPVSLEPERTRALCALAAASGLALVENVLFVHHSQHREIRQFLLSGAVGEVRGLHAAFTIPRLPDTDIRYQAQLGGGALWDVGVYPVRAAMHYLGSGLTVAGAVRTIDAAAGVDTAGAAVLRAPSGALATLTFGMDHGYCSAIEVCGSEGRMVIDAAFTPRADHQPTVTLLRAGGVSEIPLSRDDQAANAVRAFVHAIRTRAAPAAAIVDQAELLDAVRERAEADFVSNALRPPPENGFHD